MIITRQLIRGLADINTSPCVSMFLPVHREGIEVHQERIRFRNLLRKAEEELTSRFDMPAERAQEFLQPLTNLAGDELFWKEHGQGVAVYRSESVFLPLHLPYDVEENISTDTRFHLLPVLSLLELQNRFYVLALSQQNARLIDASDVHAHEVPVGEFREGFEAIFRINYEKPALSFHSDGAAHGMFHGQGAVKDQKKKTLEEFLHAIDDIVSALLVNEKHPLILAASEPIVGRFREICSYPHLLEQDIRGNPDMLSPEQLRDKAWEIIQPMIHDAQRSELERFGTMMARKQATNDPLQVLSTAKDGRVETLFIRDDHLPSTLGPRSRADRKTARLPDDLRARLDAIVTETLLHDGFVHTLAPQDMPSQAPVAAILRY